ARGRSADRPLLRQCPDPPDQRCPRRRAGAVGAVRPPPPEERAAEQRDAAVRRRPGGRPRRPAGAEGAGRDRADAVPAGPPERRAVPTPEGRAVPTGPERSRPKSDPWTRLIVGGDRASIWKRPGAAP